MMEIVPLPEVAIGPVTPTKEFSYWIGFFYGSDLQQDDWHDFELFFENKADMYEFVIKEIEYTYQHYKDTSNNGFILEVVSLEIVNIDAVCNTDDFPNCAICDITLYNINKDMDELIYGVDLEEICDGVFHADEEQFSSGEE